MVAGLRVRLRIGRPTAFALIPQSQPQQPLAQSTAAYLTRAGFLRHALWVTPFRGAERFPGGDYPNQSPTPQGLDVWTLGRRSLLGQDLVLWHIFGVTHIPRLEDWPVMPAETTGFKLVPAGFFDASPAMAVPTTRAIRSAVISSKL